MRLYGVDETRTDTIKKGSRPRGRTTPAPNPRKTKPIPGANIFLKRNISLPFQFAY